MTASWIDREIVGSPIATAGLLPNFILDINNIKNHQVPVIDQSLKSLPSYQPSDKIVVGNVLTTDDGRLERD